MLRNLRYLSTGQRRFVFFVVFIGVLLALIGGTILLAASAVNSGERPVAVAFEPNVTVAEFAALPDADAYPPAVAVAPDGTVYTGSFVSGTLWAISSDGTVRELPGTREAVGAVAGLTVAPDGTLYIVDQLDPDPRSAGGEIKRLAPGGAVETFATIDDERGFVTPDDLEFDAAGRLYVTDRGRNEVWRFDADGSGGTLWWTPPAPPEGSPRGAVTGLAYDPAADSLYVTDPDTNTLYAVDIASAVGRVVYQEPAGSAAPPGFDGAAVAADGALYIAALGQNTVVTVRDGRLPVIAGRFRGAADVAAAADGRLYVANFDQSSLVVPLLEPRLPFAIDVIRFTPPAEVTP